MVKRIAITGASGFLGGHLFNYLTSDYRDIQLVSRNRASEIGGHNCSIDSKLSLSDCSWLGNVDVVIHCAARAHVMDEYERDPIIAYREVNTKGTIKLAEFAATQGVKRFIYISSIKVHGERNKENEAITENAQLEPIDPYGVSKLEAETGLWKIAAKTEMEVVIIRPPLIYGPGVKANFETMMKYLYRGLPIPLGGAKNRRSLVGIFNLCDFIKLCIEHPKAAGESFLISDQCDVSTSELLRKLKTPLNSKAVILQIPAPIMNFCFKLAGKRQMAQRLFDDLYVSSDKATKLLGWRPPFSVQDQLDKTATHFRQNSGKSE